MKQLLMWLQNWLASDRSFHNRKEEISYQASFERSKDQAIFYKPTG